MALIVDYYDQFYWSQWCIGMIGLTPQRSRLHGTASCLHVTVYVSFVLTCHHTDMWDLLTEVLTVDKPDSWDPQIFCMTCGTRPIASYMWVQTPPRHHKWASHPPAWHVGPTPTWQCGPTTDHHRPDIQDPPPTCHTGDHHDLTSGTHHALTRAK